MERRHHASEKNCSLSLISPHLCTNRKGGPPTIELFWKTLKRAIRHEGIRVETPRESVKEAFRIGWLHDERAWLDMLDSRNTTSHEYLSESLASDNYEDVKKVTPILRKAFEVLKSRHSDQP